MSLSLVSALCDFAERVGSQCYTYMFNYRYNISRRNVIVHAFFNAYLMLYSSLMPVGQYFLESHTKAFVKKKQQFFFFFIPLKVVIMIITIIRRITLMIVVCCYAAIP